ncbi:MAG: hypothetical protein GWN71_20870, partial [Gammaproteobacteria bacterium]|nr:hypothetical protein [Gemmatimonadota bacterium]NIU75926.1 hypothetical protein [Gammaproteobacteria bacterium]
RVRDGLTSGCPVRDQLVGSSFALTNVELRFPIFDFLDLGFAPLGLPPIGGAVFVDLGAAFDDIRQLVWGRGSSRD